MNPNDRDVRFQELYKRRYQSIVSYIMNNYRFSRDEARELAQDAFLRVYRSMDQYRGDAEWSFLRITASRVALNEVRRRTTQMRSGGVQVSIEEHSQLPDSPASPEGDLVEREEAERRKRWLHNSIERLPDTLQECVLLRISGLEYNEIQETLNISLDAVKARLHKARRQLKALLAEEPDGIDWPSASGEDDHDQEK